MAEIPYPAVTEPVNWEELFAQQRLLNGQLLDAHRELVDIIAALEHPASMETIVINPGNNGAYSIPSRGSHPPSKSLGVLNPGTVPVFVGLGGLSSNIPASRAPSMPGQSALVLPVRADYLELGCDPAALGASTAVVFLFRFATVQALFLRTI